MKLEQIYIYPIKSLPGIQLPEWRINERGFQWDRHWMLVDENGLFVTQREFALLAKIQLSLSDTHLVLDYSGMEQLTIGLEDTSDKTRMVTVWKDSLEALQINEQIDEWFSRILAKPVSLVVMQSHAVRQVDQSYANETDQTGFSDGFPFLLIGQSSLDDLSARVGETLSMRRFRPNLVVSGSQPYAEDSWKHISIGNVDFRVVKPCSRCVITTIDPVTAKKSPEPLKTLATFRRKGNQVYFGQNLIHDMSGTLQTGMTVTVND